MDDGGNGLPADAKGPTSCDIHDRKRPYERNRGDCSWTPTSTTNDTPVELESTQDLEEQARREGKPEAPNVRVKKMDTWISGLVLVLAPALLVSEAAVGIAVWWQRPGVLERFPGGRLVRWLLRKRPLGIGALAGTWVLLTVASWWCLLLYTYIAVNLLYFWLGSAGGWAGLISAGALSVCVPFVWGTVLVGLARRDFGRAVPKEPTSVVGGVDARVGASL